MVTHDTFSAIFDPRKGNVYNLGVSNPQIINITSVLITFSAIFDSHREMLIIWGVRTPNY